MSKFDQDREDLYPSAIMPDWDTTSVHTTVATTAESNGIVNTYHSQDVVSDGTALCGNRTRQRKTMSEECLKCEYATYDCQSYGACRKR